jgi:hypothetical protein
MTTLDWISQSMGVLVQLMLVIFGIWGLSLLYIYVRSVNAGRTVDIITRFANVGIDLAENLDQTGKLDVPPEYEKGAYKLKIASDFAGAELERVGVIVSTENAEKWVSSQFQKRLGDVRPVNDVATLTEESVDLVLDLEKRGVLETPTELERESYLAGLVADLVQTKLAAKNWASVPRDELVVAARSELLARLASEATDEEKQDPLVGLAREAVAFVQQLKAQGQLSVQPGTANENVEADVATAWLLTEVAKRGLTVSSTQIMEAVTKALRNAVP